MCCGGKGGIGFCFVGKGGVPQGLGLCPVAVADKATEDGAVLVEEEGGGKAFDVHFLREGAVGGFLFFRHVIAVGDVDVDEFEVLLGVACKVGLVKDVLFEHFAGWAPVGASEDDQDGFAAALGLAKGCV